MSAESSRFQHLLQPIRDLSKNWNIDLAQELEEYLDELEGLTIAFDRDGVQVPTAAAAVSNSAQLMNFAEAALLIQGTSMIYSRKVEYLYALVFQTLAHLSKRHGDGSAPVAEQDDGAQGDDAGREDDDDSTKRSLDALANPLPIYDALDEARNITLKKSAKQPMHTRHGRPDMVKSKNNIQASIALMGSLVPDERDHGETFKLLSCHLHPSGVLLMDEVSKKYLQDEQDLYARSFAPTPAHRRLQHTPMAKLNFDGLNTSMASDGPADYGGHDDHDDDNDPMDDGGYDFGGGYDGADNEDDGRAEGMDDIFAGPIKPEPANGTGAGTSSTTKYTVGRGSRSASAGDAKDPWAPLDAYDASKSTVRPFRKGRSYPARSAKKMLANKKKSKGLDEDEMDGVDDPAFKDRFLLSANRPQWSTWVWNDLDDRAFETKFKKKYCKSQCLMTSCESLWRLETKWKSVMRKCVASEEQSANAILLQEQAEEEEEQQIHALALNRNGPGLGINDAFVSDPQQQDVDGGDDDDDDYDAGADNGVDYDGGDADDWGQNTSYSLLDGAGAAMLKNGGFGQPAAEQEGERALSYEEICRQHLEEFMKGTEKYIRETDLSRKVSDWQDKLSPVLREQDARPPFDIHKYGQNILEHLETSKGSDKKSTKRRKRKQDEGEEEDIAVPFGEVVGGLNQFEVCRMFLASLQLANNGNVQLHHGKTAADQALVPFEMELLTTSNVYESLQHETVVG